MAAHGGGHGLGPGERLVAAAVAALGGQCPRDVDQRDGERLLRRAGCAPTRRACAAPRRVRLRAPPPRGPAAGDRASAVRRSGSDAADSRTSASASPMPASALGREQRAVDLLEAGLRQRGQVSGEIPAVDRRDVGRIERAQRARVVPVVVMSAEALHAEQRVERRLETLDGVEQADPAEVARGHRREQIEPDVRRRGPVRDDRLRILLEVVGRERVVLGADERLEEAPGPPGGEAEQRCLGGASGTTRAARGGRLMRRATRGDSIQSATKGAASSQLSGRRAATSPALTRATATGAAMRGRTPGSSRADARLRLRSGHPLEEAPLHAEAEERARDRVEHQACVMREQRHVQRHLRRAQRQVGRDALRVAALRDARPARHDLEQRGQERRDADARRARTASRPPRARATSVQAATRVRSAHGAESVRRRLSIIFQRPSRGTPRERRPEDPGQELPVAAGPAVLALHRQRVVPPGTPRRRRGPRRARRARRSPRRGRGSGVRSPARVPRAPPRTHRRRRYPCRCRTPLRTDPGRRPRPPRRRGRGRSDRP